MGKMFVVYDLENEKTTFVTQVKSPKLGLESNFLSYNSERRGKQWRGAKLALDRK